LIGMRIEVGVDEHAVASLARRKLQGECNQVPERSLSRSSSLRPRILRFLTTFDEQVSCLQFAFSKNTM
jgi:hypothetical protein